MPQKCEIDIFQSLKFVPAFKKPPKSTLDNPAENLSCPTQSVSYVLTEEDCDFFYSHADSS